VARRLELVLAKSRGAKVDQCGASACNTSGAASPAAQPHVSSLPLTLKFRIKPRRPSGRRRPRWPRLLMVGSTSCTTGEVQLFQRVPPFTCASPRPSPVPLLSDNLTYICDTVGRHQHSVSLRTWTSARAGHRNRIPPLSLIFLLSPVCSPPGETYLRGRLESLRIYCKAQAGGRTQRKARQVRRGGPSHAVDDACCPPRGWLSSARLLPFLD